MKKILIMAATALLSVSAFAYNPPAGGQGLWTLSSPTQLSAANSVAGGGVFAPGPDSIVFNPALPAMENRVQLDFGFSALINNGDFGDTFNSAFQTGILIPSKMFVFSGMTEGVFCEAEDLYLGKSINFRAGLSKRVFEQLSFGVNLYGGYLWDAGTDWSVGADVGFLYRKDELGFMKDFRIGASFMNLGKVYNDAELVGVDFDEKVDGFPTILTLKTGVAANFVKTDDLILGCSFDFTTPFFQNAIIDAGFQVGIKDTVFVSVAERIDVRESVEGVATYLPAISVSYKFNLNVKNSSYAAKHDWTKNDMTASLGWRQCAEYVHAVSGGVKLKLGQDDTQAPVIQLWDEEE